MPRLTPHRLPRTLYHECPCRGSPEPTPSAWQALKDVATKLKRSTVVLCKNLRMNPGTTENMMKMEEERRSIQLIVEAALDEILENGTCVISSPLAPLLEVVAGRFAIYCVCVCVCVCVRARARDLHSFFVCCSCWILRLLLCMCVLTLPVFTTP